MAEIGMPDGRRNTNRGGRSHPAPTAPVPNPRHHKTTAALNARTAEPEPSPEPVVADAPTLEAPRKRRAVSAEGV